jgi:uncharacterized membrane protein required for colicin V production
MIAFGLDPVVLQEISYLRSAINGVCGFVISTVSGFTGVVLDYYYYYYYLDKCFTDRIIYETSTNSSSSSNSIGKRRKKEDDI